MPKARCRVSRNTLWSKPTAAKRLWDALISVSKSLMRHSTSALLTGEPKHKQTLSPKQRNGGAKRKAAGHRDLAHWAGSGDAKNRHRPHLPPAPRAFPKGGGGQRGTANGPRPSPAPRGTHSAWPSGSATPPAAPAASCSWRRLPRRCPGNPGGAAVGPDSAAG